VSGHVNHASLYYGARHFVAALAARRDDGGGARLDLYALRSVALARKYTGFADAAWTLAGHYFGRPAAAAVEAAGGNSNNNNNYNDERRKEGAGNTGGEDDAPSPPPDRLVFMSGLGGNGWGKSWRAMTAAHRSQMVWFRWGWIVFSRY